jgi:hypothetical protein
VHPLESVILGNVGKLSVAGDVEEGPFIDVAGAGAGIKRITIMGNLDGSGGGDEAGLIRTEGNIGAVTIMGDVIGGAPLSGILAGGKTWSGENRRGPQQ